jgi:hypothetical protein
VFRDDMRAARIVSNTLQANVERSGQQRDFGRFEAGRPPHADVARGAHDDPRRALGRFVGQRCDARVGKQDGAMELTIESRGLWALFLDLHTGKGGGAWWIAIDLAGVLWVLVAATGLVLWLQLKKRRRVGAFWLVVGTAAGALMFVLLAP